MIFTTTQSHFVFSFAFLGSSLYEREWFPPWISKKQSSFNPLIYHGRLTAGTCPHRGLVQMIFLSNWVICMFHVNLPGCNLPLDWYRLIGWSRLNWVSISWYAKHMYVELSQESVRVFTKKYHQFGTNNHQSPHDQRHDHTQMLWQGGCWMRSFMGSGAGPRRIWSYVRSGRNSPILPCSRGWETQPVIGGLYAHYKDSLLKNGWPFP